MLKNSSPKDNSRQSSNASHKQSKRNAEHSFNEDELSKLRGIFNAFDVENKGTVSMLDVENIMKKLETDLTLIERVLGNGFENLDVDFNDFLEIVCKLEKQTKEEKGDMPPLPKESKEERKKKRAQKSPDQKNPYKGKKQDDYIVVKPDYKVIDFMRILEEYRIQCEQKGNYQEAGQAQAKFEELRVKESQRQKNALLAEQEKELQMIESAQKKQFIDFSQSWDNYMNDYEAVAFLSIEKLREKHLNEIAVLKDTVRREIVSNYVHPQEVLELRRKEHLYVSKKNYEQAEEIRRQIVILEEYEKVDMEAQIEEAFERREGALKIKQHKALTVLMNRIQRDRNEQLHHRQQDSQRLLQRNKNILKGLLNKQTAETKKTLEYLSNILSNTKIFQSPPKRVVKSEGKVRGRREEEKEGTVSYDQNQSFNVGYISNRRESTYPRSNSVEEGQYQAANNNGGPLPNMRSNTRNSQHAPA